MAEVDFVRRRLLKGAAYVPPAMLGVMIAGAKVAEAAQVLPGQTKVCKGGGTITVSAGGNACCPCVPGNPKYNPNKCELARCKLGNCAACKRAIFKNLKQCQKKTARAGCACTCTQIAPGIVKCI
ncbi:MAG: hypothetical protein D6771_06095 [Zetaproteobacteria bacterium]|nr:MAG: hypothetical protein D6771_06095 [Zetaproteobacteria bacterium]